MASARVEQLRRRRLTLEEAFIDPLGQVPHRLDRADEIAEAALFTPVDEFDVGGMIHLQPLENRRQGVRNTAALAVDQVRPDQSTSSR